MTITHEIDGKNYVEVDRKAEVGQKISINTDTYCHAIDI